MSILDPSETTVDLVLETRWRGLMARMEKRFEMPMDLDGMLFMIGVQELGQHGRIFAKDEKLGLMHIAVSVILGPYGYYREVRRDEDGWPHYEKIKELPQMTGKEQEHLLKEAVLAYFGE